MHHCCSMPFASSNAFTNQYLTIANGSWILVAFLVNTDAHHHHCLVHGPQRSCSHWLPLSVSVTLMILWAAAATGVLWWPVLFGSICHHIASIDQYLVFASSCSLTRQHCSLSIVISLVAFLLALVFLVELSFVGQHECLVLVCHCSSLVRIIAAVQRFGLNVVIQQGRVGKQTICPNWYENWSALFLLAQHWPPSLSSPVVTCMVMWHCWACGLWWQWEG